MLLSLVASNAWVADSQALNQTSHRTGGKDCVLPHAYACHAARQFACRLHCWRLEPHILCVTLPSYPPPFTQVVGADLDQPSTLEPHLARATGLYCHALSGDAATADPAELARAHGLADLAARYRDQLRLVVYNSSAGRGSDAGISQVGVFVCVCVMGGDGAEGDFRCKPTHLVFCMPTAM